MSAFIFDFGLSGEMVVFVKQKFISSFDAACQYLIAWPIFFIGQAKRREQNAAVKVQSAVRSFVSRRRHKRHVKGQFLALQSDLTSGKVIL